ncbi:MAG: L-threonylcarbamoyladenylate synthase [Thermoflexibacter sp.]
MIGKDIDLAIKLLEEGQLVGIPTETVYGLAGNALDENAVTQIFKVKNRPIFDPLIVHTNSLEKVHDFVLSMPEKAHILAKHFWAGALTLLLPKKNIIPDLVTSGSPLVAIRIPNHALTLEVLSRLDFPLAAPSANPFGYISPTTAQHVEAQLGSKIPYILDGGSCQLGLESTIVGFEQEQAIVYRKGGISIEAIEKVIGKIEVKAHSSSNPQAPGMLKSHYAPRIPLILGEIGKLIQEYAEKKIGILSFKKYFDGIPTNQQFILSEKEDFGEAAKNLFAAMRTLDQMDIEVILADLLPEQDLGRAINDRLRRAAAKS